MEKITIQVEVRFSDRGATVIQSNLWHSTLWALIPTMPRRFRTSLGGELADCLADIFVKVQEIGERASIEKDAIGVDVCEVDGHQAFIATHIEDACCDRQPD